MAKQYHIDCGRNDLGRYCILPGDPGRSVKIAAYFEKPLKVAENREFVTYTGYLMGQKVSVTSTGIGGPSAAIALEELSALGVHTFIRVGTCGGINMEVMSGDCVIATGAVRQEGTSREYAPLTYPAVSDFHVATALWEACEMLGYNCHAGVVQSKDSFYGQQSPDRMPISTTLQNNWEALKRLGVLASEMETAALYTVAASLGVRCGCVLSVLWNQERKAAGFNEADDLDTDKSVRAAVEAIKLLIMGKKRAGRNNCKGKSAGTSK